MRFRRAACQHRLLVERRVKCLPGRHSGAQLSGQPPGQHSSPHPQQLPKPRRRGKHRPDFDSRQCGWPGKVPHRFGELICSPPFSSGSLYFGDCFYQEPSTLKREDHLLALHCDPLAKIGADLGDSRRFEKPLAATALATLFNPDVGPNRSGSLSLILLA
jgi:hypothetical protein